MDNSRLVYSTETGSICPLCQKPVSKGKTVTTVSAFQLADDELKSLAARLKRKCGTGGSVKDGIIIIQGDHRDALLSELKKQGYTAKLAGG